MQKIGSLCLVAMLLMSVFSVFSVIFSGTVKAEPDDVVWNNGGTFPGSIKYNSMNDTNFPLLSQVADDFLLDDDTIITGVYWYGGFWDDDPFDPCDFWVFFYADDGTGNKPTGDGMPDPAPTALASYFFPDVTGLPLDTNGFYSYSVDLPEPFEATGGEKYWLAVQAVFFYPPAWGWSNSDAIQLQPAVRGFPLMAVDFWNVLDPAVDMAFYLTGREPGESPNITEVYPINSSVRVNKKVQCYVNVTDPDGDTMNVSFYENTTGSWVLSHYEDVTGTVVYWNYTNAARYSNTYWWKVVVDDGTDNVSGIYHFTTRSKPSEDGGEEDEEQVPEGELPSAGISFETIMIATVLSACAGLSAAFVWIYYKW